MMGKTQLWQWFSPTLPPQSITVKTMGEAGSGGGGGGIRMGLSWNESGSLSLRS